MKKFVIVNVEQQVITYIIEAETKQDAEYRANTIIGGAPGVIISKTVNNMLDTAAVIEL